MKRTILTLSICFLALSSLFAQKYDIRLNLQPNLRVPLRMTTSVKNEINIPGQGQQQNSTMILTEIAFYVKAMKGDNYIIHGIVNKREISSEAMGQKMLFSSADSVDNQYNKDLRAMAGKTFVAEITPRFKLVGEVKPLNDDMTLDVAKKAFGVFQELFEHLYPANPLEKGETWTVKDEKQGVDATATLSDVTENSYIIDARVGLNKRVQGMTLKGEGTQNIEINRQLGIPVYGLTTLPAKGSVATPGGVVSVSVNTISSFEFIQ